MLELRVDDFPGTKPAEFNEHNLENFIKFHDVVVDYFDSYVLGVIPMHLNDSHYNFFREDKKWSVHPAMHGFIHDESKQNEFDGVSKYMIKMMLTTFQNRFFSKTDRDIDAYVPPHNVIDINTIQALKECGFKKLFIGPETSFESHCFAADVFGIDNVHYSAKPLLYGRTDELYEMKAHEYIKELLNDRDSPIVSEHEDVYLTLHWPWEWNIGLDHMKRFFDNVFSRT